MSETSKPEWVDTLEQAHAQQVQALQAELTRLTRMVRFWRQQVERKANENTALAEHVRELTARQYDWKPSDGPPQPAHTFDQDQALQARNAELEAEVAHLTHQRAVAAEMIHRQVQTIEALRSPCACEPPGSGEVCNQWCRLPALVQQEMDARGNGIFSMSTVLEIVAGVIGKLGEGQP